jgi:hypothetical protein
LIITVCGVNADARGRLDEKDVQTVNFSVGHPFRHP